MEKDEQANPPGAEALPQTNPEAPPQTNAGTSPKTNATDTEGTSGIKGLLVTNATLAVWLVFLALGGGLLALYYSRIGYMPDIEWGSSIVYLAAASFIGGGVGLVFVLSLFLPGFIWATFLVSDPQLATVFCFDKSGKEPCVRSIWRHLGQPFVVVLFSSHILLLVCLIGTTYYVVIAMVPLTLSSIFMWLRFRRLLLPPVRNGEVTQREEQERHRRIFKFTFWFALSVLLSQISMLLVYLLSKKPTWGAFVVLTFICTIGVVGSALIVAERYSQHLGHAVVASLVIAMLLLLASDRNASLSEQVMARYGFGGNHKVNLLLKPEGGKIISRLGLPPTPCAQPAEDKLCGVEILSMIGNEYYLRLGDRTFTLPKEVVTSRDSGEAGK